MTDAGHSCTQNREIATDVFKTEGDIQIAMVLSLEHIDSRRIEIYNICDSLLVDRWTVIGIEYCKNR